MKYKPEEYGSKFFQFLVEKNVHKEFTEALEAERKVPLRAFISFIKSPELYIRKAFLWYVKEHGYVNLYKFNQGVNWEALNARWLERIK